MPAPSTLDPLGRFSNRVKDYVRYRPSYPAELIAHLRAHAGLGPACAVADVGAGTGIFTRLLLETGARVFAVEPNDAMRGAAEAELSGHPSLTSVKGTSEQTGLEDGSVDLITCAQSFHWFEPEGARREFRRILRPGGGVALVWNGAPERRPKPEDVLLTFFDAEAKDNIPTWWNTPAASASSA